LYHICKKSIMVDSRSRTKIRTKTKGMIKPTEKKRSFVRTENGKSKVEFKTLGEKIEIVNTKGNEDDLKQIITRIKKTQAKEITVKVPPGDIEMIKLYLSKGFTSKIRYVNGKISMTHIRGKKKSIISKNKVLQKIYDIMDAIITDEYVPIQVTLDPKFLMEVNDYLSKNHEYGGVLRLSEKKYSLSKKKYSFVAKKSRVVKGPTNNFKVPIPERIYDRKEFLSFHTHPRLALIKDGGCIAPPSEADYLVVAMRTLLFNEPAHIVFASDTIYAVELTREMRALGRRMNIYEKSEFFDKLKIALEIYLRPSYDVCFFYGDVRKAIINAGGAMRQIGAGSKTTYEVDLKGQTYKFNHIYEILKAATNEGIFNFNFSQLRTRRNAFFSKINEHVCKINLWNMRVYDIINKYGVPGDKLKNPIFEVKAYATDAGGDFFTHNYSKPIVMTINQDIRLMKKALSRSPTYYSQKSLSWEKTNS